MTSAENSTSKQTLTFKKSNLPAPFLEMIQSGGEIYEVGGPIRDGLLGRPVKDHDILVRKLPIETIRIILKKYGQVHLVGKSFGVLKFRPTDNPDMEYDIALPRQELSTGTGHRDFDVTFDPDLPIEEDLTRRDFTINAMAFDYQMKRLIDPLSGQRDLAKKILRQVNPRSFVDDPLRLMRAIQFAARFHLTIEDQTWEGMKESVALLETVSPERIALEIGKLLEAPKPSVGFCLMRDVGLLPYIFPELAKTVGVEQGRKLKNDDVFMHSMRVLDAARQDPAIPYAGNLELMIAALFHDVGKPKTKRYDKKKQRLTFYGHQFLSRKLAENRMRELKMTTLGVQPSNVATLIENHMFQAKSFFTDKAIRRFIRNIGEDLILKLVDLRTADNRGGKYPEGIHGIQKLRKRIEAELARRPAITVGDLAIDGHDLMSMGIPAGPEIGHILRNLLEVVIDDPKQNEKKALLRIVHDTLGYNKDTTDVVVPPKKEGQPTGE